VEANSARQDIQNKNNQKKPICITAPAIVINKTVFTSFFVNSARISGAEKLIKLREMHYTPPVQVCANK
jgi:hypothetical protein